MADVNAQVVDAVTAVNVKVLAEAPAMALANLYQATGQALSLAAQNAVTAQQNSNVILQATTTQGVALLYALDTGTTTVSLAELLSVLKSS
jgi:hypothetical protein